MQFFFMLCGTSAINKVKCMATPGKQQNNRLLKSVVEANKITKAA